MTTLLTRFYRFVRRRKRLENIASHISAQRAALRETNRQIDAYDARFYREDWICCPSCAFGKPYANLCDRAVRQQIALISNLTKRATLEDMREARVLFTEVGRGVLPAKLEKRLTRP